MDIKKKTEKIATKALLIVLIIVSLCFMIIATGCNNPKINNPSQTDIIYDSILNNATEDPEGHISWEYHGKEGDSEYGEYENGN